MKKFTIIVISLFMVLLISLSSVGEAMGTSSKYASNQDYIQSENLALKDKSNKMTDGKDSSVYCYYFSYFCNIIIFYFVFIFKFIKSLFCCCIFTYIITFLPIF